MQRVGSMLGLSQWSIRLALAVATLAGSHAWRPASARAFDLKRTERGALVRWHTDTVTFAVSRPGSGAVSAGELARATEIALDAWRGMPGLPELVVCPAASSRHCAADVTIEAPDEWHFDARRLAVTLDTYDAASGALVSARVIVNPGFPTAVVDEARPDRTVYDLASTLAHEIGHVLGLAESGFREATMWPDGGRGDVIARTLDVDDEQAIATLYEARDAREPLLYACQAVPTAPSSRAVALSLAVILGVAAVRLRRRHRLHPARRRGRGGA